MNGYLPIPRDFFTSPIWKEKRTFSKVEAYLDLLHFAAFAPSERIVSGKLIELDEGELPASVRFLADRWGWGKDRVANYLKLLEQIRYARRETRQGETVVILLKYKDWRDQTDVRLDSKPDTDPDTGQTVTRTNKNKERRKEERAAPAREAPPRSPFADTHPTETANHMDAIVTRINNLAPTWKRRPHLTAQEMHDLVANLKAFNALEDYDWTLLAEYMRAVIPTDPAAEGFLGKFFQPDQRSKFIQAVSDVLQHADRWAQATKWKPAA